MKKAKEFNKLVSVHASYQHDMITIARCRVILVSKAKVESFLRDMSGFGSKKWLSNDDSDTDFSENMGGRQT